MRPLVFLVTTLVFGAWLALHHASGDEPYSTPKSSGSSYETRASQTAGTDAALVLFDYSAKPNDIVPWLKKNETLLNRGDGCTLSVHWASAEPKPMERSRAVHEIASLIVAPGDAEPMSEIA